MGSAQTPGDTIVHGFLYTAGVMYDLNNLIPAGSGWELTYASALNDAGQIVGQGIHNGETHAFRLDPVLPYQALIQRPINSDGTSVFNASRGVIPVKFSLTQFGQATCNLPPATISLKRTAGGSSIDESVYVTPSDTDSQFRINGCQYLYNLRVSSLGPGSYFLEIAINGETVGTATFGLK